MNNQIYRVTAKQYAEIERELKKDPNIYIGEIDGASIQTEKDFLDAVWVAFKFPSGYKSIDGYLDWICDLQWLNASEFVFVVLNFYGFMKDDKLRGKFIYLLEDAVIPWWNKDVALYQVGGKPKPFNVYLVD